MSRAFALSLGLAVVCAGCAGRAERERAFQRADGSSFLVRADQVLEALRDHNGSALATLVHPDKGVRFSPSAYVDVAEDRVLSASQVESLWQDEKVYRWGYEEGSGDPIELAPRDYVARYVLVGGQDFSRPSSVNVDDDRAAGNTRNNAAEVYPGATRIEYFVTASGDGNEPGHDWVALRLVFEEKDSRPWLVGAIHDAWSP